MNHASGKPGGPGQTEAMTELARLGWLMLAVSEIWNLMMVVTILPETTCEFLCIGLFCPLFFFSPF